MHRDFNRILDSFKGRYGDKQGTAEFNRWVAKRSLDTSKPYGNAQLCKKDGEKECKGICRSCECFKEAFQWAKPLIKLLKNDETGKTYQIEANFVITSMNGNVYTREENAQAISTLPNKRVDLNHNKDWVIKGCDMLAAAFEDDCAEVLLHVNNGARDAKGRDVQEAIEKGVIDCVSIEANAAAVQTTPEGTEPLGMYYEGLALLDQDALPGIPLTRIRSLETIMESIFGEVEQLEHLRNSTEVKEKMSESENKNQPSKTAALTAQFCPICGAQLDENGACPSKDCPAFGAKIVANSEAKAVNASIAKKVESKNCGTCGQFLDAAGKCTNINCVAVALGRKTGALSNEAVAENAELLQNKAENICVNSDLSGNLAEAVKAGIALEAKVESLKTEYSNEIAKLKEKFEAEKRALESEVSKRDGILAEKTKAIEKALLENKRVYKILNEAGFMVVDGAGNIVSK